MEDLPVLFGFASFIPLDAIVPFLSAKNTVKNTYLALYANKISSSFDSTKAKFYQRNKSNSFQSKDKLHANLLQNLVRNLSYSERVFTNVNCVAIFSNLQH